MTLVCGHSVLQRPLRNAVPNALAIALCNQLTSQFFAEGCPFRNVQTVAASVWDPTTALAPSQPMNSPLHIATIAAILVCYLLFYIALMCLPFL